ncbi:MAG: DNA alkylation repair protein [Cyclobacteriaceae bacterium]|nr:DNA alkylation repair protein [Cyclobacteriaceae bacterium]
MANVFHQEILQQIIERSGTPTQHTFVDTYLGNDHPRYPISIPVLRKIAREWMKEYTDLPASAFSQLLTSLIKGKSSTEKCMVGILLDYATPEQRKFDPKAFDSWLDHLVGWAEVDSLCTGKYSNTEIPENWKNWKPLLVRFNKSKNIQKRRASLVLLCSPMRNVQDDRLRKQAFENIDRLKSDKEILITKAISWLLRNMAKHYRSELIAYLNKNQDTLPTLAVRETMAKLKTGRKTKKKV